jgi:hypothetical protein
MSYVWNECPPLFRGAWRELFRLHSWSRTLDGTHRLVLLAFPTDVREEACANTGRGRVRGKIERGALVIERLELRASILRRPSR